jgi:PAS domain S-box-containing protein
MENKNKLKPVFFLVLAMELILFVIDYFVPSGYGLWFIYILPMVLIWRTTTYQIIIMTAIVSILVMLAVFVTVPGGVPLVTTVTNHIGGVLVIWVISILIISQINSNAALYKSEQKYKRLAENTPEVIARFDLNFRHIYLNSFGLKFLGIKQEEVIGKTVLDLGMPSEMEDTWNRNFQEVIRNGAIKMVDIEIDSPKFGHQWLSSFFVPEYDENGKVVSVLAITRDITDIKKTEMELKKSEKRLRALNENLENTVRQRTEQVRKLSKELMRVELRERKRFSYILHENVQQMLLGARLLLNQHLRDHAVEQAEDKQDDLADAQTILNRALKMTRSISIELNPPILPNQGLGSSLGWLINYMQKSYGLKIISHIEWDVESIKGELQLMLTQMVRELLSNVVQHSGVSEAQLEVKCLNCRIEIVVSDKGKGFNSGEVFERRKDETRLGLFSISERLSLFGGELIIQSVIGQGTTCTLVLPLKKF